MIKTIRFVSRYMGTIRYKKRCMLIKTIQYDSIRCSLRIENRCEETMDLILEHFLKCLIKYLLTNLRKDLRWIHERLEMCSYLKALSHAPELAYRNAPPAP